MKLIDYPRYADQYSPDRFLEKLKKRACKWGKKVARPLALLYCALVYGRLSAVERLRVVGMLGYFILPTDFLPDFIAGIGYSDDLLGAALLLRQLHKSITPEVKAQAEFLLQDWLGKEE